MNTSDASVSSVLTKNKLKLFAFLISVSTSGQGCTESERYWESRYVVIQTPEGNCREQEDGREDNK